MSVLEVARRLPGISSVEALSQSMAMLDAILCPEWQHRSFSFDTAWAQGERMASMRNGSGDEYAIVFTAAGAFARGFDHESPMSPYGLDPVRPWPGVVDEVPAEFAEQVTEPAFNHLGLDGEPFPAVTACFWRGIRDDEWRTGTTIEFPDGYDDPDGALFLFEMLVEGTPEAYQRHAADTYGIEINLATVRRVYAHEPLTEGLVAALNPDVRLADLTGDTIQIGFPGSA